MCTLKVESVYVLVEAKFECMFMFYFIGLFMFLGECSTP